MSRDEMELKTIGHSPTSELTPVEDTDTWSSPWLNSGRLESAVTRNSTTLIWHPLRHKVQGPSTAGPTSVDGEAAAAAAAPARIQSGGGQKGGSEAFRAVIKWNLAYLQFCSKFFGAPLTVHDQKVSVDRGAWKRFFWLFNFSFLMLRTIYMAIGFFLSCTVDQFRNPAATTFYFLSVELHFYLTASIYEIFERGGHVETLAGIWNCILKHQWAVVKVPWFKTCFMIVVPQSIPVLSIMVSSILILNPSFITQYRYAVHWALAEGFLEDGLQYRTLLLLSIAADYWSYFAVCPFFVSIQHMVFLEMWTAVSEDLLTRSAAVAIGPQQVWRKLCQLMVMLKTFNIVNATFAFYLKSACISNTIFIISSLLLIDFKGDVLMISAYVSVGMLASTFYPVSYGRAYLVATNIQRAKAQLPAVLTFRQQDESFDRRIRSVQQTGIWIGGFRTFERESTLLYVSFIFDQIVSLVLAYK